MYNNRFKKRKGRAFIFLFIPALLLLFSAIVMWLWNAILPSLIHVNNIGYWQAAGLLVLCRILFGGFKFGSRGGSSFGNGNYMRSKWMNMSSEEKEHFKSEWQKRCRPPQKPDEPKQ